MKYSDILNEKELMTLRDAAFDAMREYGKHINDTTDVAEVERLASVCSTRIREYTDAAKSYTFERWLESDKPMKAALADGVFPTLTLKEKGKKGAKSVELGDDMRIFNLNEFITFSVQSGKSVVASNAWVARLEEAHKTLCGFLVSELHSDGLKAQFLAEMDIDFLMKSGKTSCGENEFKKRYTKGAIDRTLQALFDALLYEDETNGGKNKYVVKTHNRNAILYTYAKMDNKVIGKILFRNNNRFMDDVTKEFAVIVRNGEHCFDGYPVSKENK